MPLPPPSIPHPEDVSADLRSAADGSRGLDTTSQARRSRNVDLLAMLAKISENDAARWMLVKDRLDHGPFSGRELVQLIERGEARREHAVINLDTGQRLPSVDTGDFAPFVHQREREERRQAELAALNRSEKHEKRSNVAKLLVVALVLGSMGAVTVGFVLSRKAARERRSSYAELAALYERGDVRMVGTVEMLPQSGPVSRSRSAARHGSARGGTSYEGAMNRVVNLGDVSRGGSETQLSGAEVAATMNRHVREFFGCVGAELRSGGAVGTVQLDVAVAGSGQVLGASARQGSEGFRRCVQAKVLKIRFPKFGAARMGARYSFRVQ